MKKILIISSFFKPGFRAGGPIQSIYNLCLLLGKYYDIYIVTQNFDLNSNACYDIPTNVWIDLGNCKVKYLSKKDFNLNNILSESKVLQVDFLYLNGIFNYLSIVVSLHFSFISTHYKLILAPRGELDPGALGLKKVKKYVALFFLKNCFSSKIIFHATNDLEKSYIKNIFSFNKAFVSSNISKIVNIKPNRLIKNQSNTSLVFISRISPKKNLLYLINFFCEFNFKGNITLNVIGPVEDKIYWLSVLESVKKLPSNVSFNYLGEVDNDKLIQASSSFHFFILPTLGENYGHAIYEALSFGLPVLISNNTPWVNEPDNGIFTWSLNSKSELFLILNNLHSLNNFEFSILSNKAYNYALNYFDENKLVQSYKKIFS